MTNPQTAPADAPLWQLAIETAGGAYVADRDRAAAVLAALGDGDPAEYAAAIQDDDGGAEWGVWTAPLPEAHAAEATAALEDGGAEPAWSVLVGGIRYLITVPLP